MKLSEFQSDIQSAMQRSVSNTALMNRWINNAIREFAYAFKFRELEKVFSWVTVANTPSYIIGVGQAINIADFRYVNGDDGLRLTGPSPTGANTTLGSIIPESRKNYLKYIGDTSDTSTYAQPQFYHKYGNTLFLRPIPDMVYNLDLYYWAKITPLVNANDVSQFDEDWDEAIFTGALYRGFRSFGEHDRYQNVRRDFLTYVNSRQTELDLEEFPEGGIQPVSWRDDIGVLQTGVSAGGPNSINDEESED